MTELNPRQEAFCLHYAQTGNATESYKQAGYAVKNDNTAGSLSSRMLQNAKIKKRLAEIYEELNSAKIASVREVQERLTSILRQEAEEQQIVVVNTGDFSSEARKVNRKAQLKDVLRAGELLARMQGGLDNSATVNLVVPVIGGSEDLED
jgi:phage terminase small subunit